MPRERCPEPETPLTTDDANKTADWAKGYIGAAIKAGLITGFEDGTFRPAAKATRAQAAILTLRLFNAK